MKPRSNEYNLNLKIYYKFGTNYYNDAFERINELKYNKKFDEV